ncbi:MAG TPA: hypothetical protein VGM97_01475 [Steroidobacteraceae bacterium]|jgi:hypothetical protein
MWKLRVALCAICVVGVARAQSAGPAAAASRDSPAPDEVTVTAQRRRDLAPRIEKFVGHIAELVNGEGLPRWKVPVCPRVIGLPQQEGEYVLGRISEIARDAAVPLAGEACRANLYIVVSKDPQTLLKNTSAANRLMIFGSENPSVIDDFIATPLPVKVYYKTSMYTSLGLPLGDTHPVPPPDSFHPRTFQQNNTSAHLSTNVIYGVSTVVTVVDQTRIKGISRGQFADYIAMVSLADIKPGANLGDAPTILKLFDGGSPANALPGMSTWDEAFLKSLYTTEQKSRLQRQSMARVIVDEIAP